jgi:hypothetical protein
MWHTPSSASRLIDSDIRKSGGLASRVRHFFCFWGAPLFFVSGGSFFYAGRFFVAGRCFLGAQQEILHFFVVKL